MNRERILASIYRYGESIEILRDGQKIVSVKAFIEPLRYKNRMYVGGKHIENGYIDGGHFTLICPKKTDMNVRGIIIRRSNGETFAVKRADDVYFKGKLLYVWAVLTPYAAQKEDVYDTTAQRIS